MSELEPGIVTDLRDRLTYGGYLRLDALLDAQRPLSGTGERPARAAAGQSAAGLLKGNGAFRGFPCVRVLP